MDNEIAKIRDGIDQVDSSILALLSERSKLVIQMRRAKNGQNIFKPSREREIIRRVVKNNKSHFSDATIEAIFTEIVTGGRNLEESLRVAYLGPEGSYSHEAAIRLLGSQSKFRDCMRLSEAVQLTERGETDIALLPFENSTEGSVAETLRILAGTSLKICGEISLKINHCLIGQAENIEEIKEVTAHPQALGQCRFWLENNLSQAKLTPATSNSAAVKSAKSNKHIAAIAGEHAAKMYSLPIISKNIQDEVGNTTRFIALGHIVAEPTGNDKTTIICTTDNKPGALHELLGIFLTHNTNLESLLSHPQPNGKYAFYIDFEGHQAQRSTQKVLKQLQSVARSCKIIGSYPKELS